MKKSIPENHWLRTRPIAHRGLHDMANGVPENSLLAFEEACKKGYPIELDVRVTRDLKAAVFHDMKLNRMTGNNKWLSNLSSKELSNIKLLKTNEHIPLLGEVLELVNGRVPVLIEIKRNLLPGIFENVVIEDLKNYSGEFAVLSFNPIALRYLHNNSPSYLSGINIGKVEKIFFQTSFFNKFINNFSFPDFISYSTNGRVPHYSTSFFKKLNRPILAWTVISKEEEIKAREFADNVIFESYTP